MLVWLEKAESFGGSVGNNTFYEAFCKLPIAIEIEMSNGKKIGLVHAELPNECDWLEVKNLLSAIPHSKIEATRETSDMLWNKAQPLLSPEKFSLIKNINNIDHVFHGHTIVEDYLTIANRTFMDLGSYSTGKIGLICPSEFLGNTQP